VEGFIIAETSNAGHCGWIHVCPRRHTKCPATMKRRIQPSPNDATGAVCSNNKRMGYLWLSEPSLPAGPVQSPNRLVVPTGGNSCLPGRNSTCREPAPGPVFNQLRLVRKMLQKTPDEVARNGALQRITSARGFLERPIAFCGAATHLVNSSAGLSALPRLITPAPASRAHQFLLGATS